MWYGKDENTPMGSGESGGIAPASAFSYFFENILTIDPGMQRKFNIPPAVHSKIIKGETFSYTDNSPLENSSRNIQDGIIF